MHLVQLRQGGASGTFHRGAGGLGRNGKYRRSERCNLEQREYIFIRDREREREREREGGGGRGEGNEADVSGEKRERDN